MEKKGIADFFEEFLEKEPLFKEKASLQANYTPENIPHRDEQIRHIAKILAPSLRLEKPSNIFLYGKTGTGKTLSVKHITNKMQQVAAKNNLALKIIYVNCKLKKIADTEYRLIAQLINEFGREIPATGLPTDEVYKIFYSTIDKEKQLVLLILDEIDQLVKKTGDEILYNFTRINAEFKNAQISLIGISNDLIFINHVDPRVKSSLSEEELVFPPYNAIQLQDILRNRSKEAFKDGVLETGLIEKCAAYAAREHGDARRALELLRVAGEIAEREGETLVKIAHLDIAEDKIEKDRMIDIVRTQPKQFQATLYAIMSLDSRKNIFTGDIYEVYQKVCGLIGQRPLTQRRISDIIAELDMIGMINAKIISKGRYGRTREITMSLPKNVEISVKTILKKELDL
ncbi:ORC1-type DNA replication protein [Candidatus Woesearchaeota archaeon]|jgi:archaeal cell division control protein 6|nr:ORC1-type DNA replication protein [Candidatus Woesearchaeota archaeon]